MRALSQILSDLIVLAEEVTTRPAALGSPHLRERLAALHAEIKHAVKLPAEGRRTTSAGAVMTIALQEILYAGGDGRAHADNLGQHWLMLAGATLPLLRAESFIAFRNERETRA